MLKIVAIFFIYADDTAVFFKHHDVHALQLAINTVLPKISSWLETNFRTLNASKTIYQVYSKRKVNVNIEVRIDEIDIKKKVQLSTLECL